MKYSSLLLIGFSFLFFFSRKKENSTPIVTPLAFVKPAHFPDPNYTIVGNEVTQDKFDLGKQLFYDPILSLDNTVSCAKCHDQAHGFSDHNIKFSNGVGGTLGERNSPALSNLAWYPNFMWDGGVNHLDVQALNPITSPVEMNETLTNVVQKLQKSEKYKSLFVAAFGDEKITGQRVLKALSQFELLLVTANSKYDKVMRKEASFTDQEQNGYQLFKINCASCHTEPLFTNGTFQNNGIPLDTTLNDIGRQRITEKSEDYMKFKVPTLRNIQFTNPYMHDGRFNKLTQVIEHYNSIIVNKSLPKQLQKRMNLTDNERVDLVAFLLTLTDNEFLFNKRFAYPR